jgi:hypothetical protein
MFHAGGGERETIPKQSHQGKGEARQGMQVEWRSLAAQDQQYMDACTALQHPYHDAIHSRRATYAILLNTYRSLPPIDREAQLANATSLKSI